MSEQETNFWKNRLVCVTGGAGFLGSFIIRKLEQLGAAEIFVPRIEQYNLVNLDDIRRIYDDARPDTG